MIAVVNEGDTERLGYRRGDCCPQLRRLRATDVFSIPCNYWSITSPSPGVATSTNRNLAKSVTAE